MNCIHVVGLVLASDASGAIPVRNVTHIDDCPLSNTKCVVYQHLSFFRATAVTKLSAPVSGSGNTTVTFVREAELYFQVVGTYQKLDSNSGPSAGDTISYLFKIENIGTTTVWSIEITSDLVGVCNPPLESRAESLELAPGDKMECTSTYRVSGVYDGFIQHHKHDRRSERGRNSRGLPVREFRKWSTLYV